MSIWSGGINPARKKSKKARDDTEDRFGVRHFHAAFVLYFYDIKMKMIYDSRQAERGEPRQRLWESGKAAQPRESAALQNTPPASSFTWALPLFPA